MFVFQTYAQKEENKNKLIPIDHKIIDKNAGKKGGETKIDMKQKLTKTIAASKKELQNELALVKDKLNEKEFLTQQQKKELMDFYAMMRTDKEILQSAENAIWRINSFLYEAKTGSLRATKMKTPIEHFNFDAKEMTNLLKISFEIEAESYYHQRMWIFDKDHCGRDRKEGKTVPEYTPLSSAVYLLASIAGAKNAGYDGPDMHSTLIWHADNKIGEQERIPLFKKIQDKGAQNYIYE